MNTYSLYDKILNQNVAFPDEISCSDFTKDIILKLLSKNPDKRLCSKNGLYELLKHDFFSQIDFDLLMEKKLAPPINITNILNKKRKDWSSETDFNEDEIFPIKPNELEKINAYEDYFFELANN
jgi:serine/threonine protein kinase